MLRLWPSTADTRPLLTNDELAHAYAYPPGLGQPYVRVNFVSSIDGAASSGGKSAALGSEADRRVFGLLRELCEVIVVGAGTVRAENYRGARRPSRATGAPPRIAVVTARGDLDPAAPLFTDTTVPPLVITANRCPPEALDRLRGAGAEVVVLDDDRVSARGLLLALDTLGLRRVLCEGGPRLFGDLIAADGVDELCLTISPQLAGGDSLRVSRGPTGDLRGMRLVGALTDQDVLLLRYARDR